MHNYAEIRFGHWVWSLFYMKENWHVNKSKMGKFGIRKIEKDNNLRMYGIYISH